MGGSGGGSGGGMKASNSGGMLSAGSNVPRFDWGTSGGPLGMHSVGAAQMGSLLNMVGESGAKTLGKKLGETLAQLGSGALMGGGQMLGQYLAAQEKNKPLYAQLEKKYARTPGQARAGSMLAGRLQNMGNIQGVTGGGAATGGVGLQQIPQVGRLINRRMV